MIKVMFVCHGNICRSPMAEFVFKDLTKKQGLSDRFFISSAATSGEEIGNPVHYGTKNKLAKLGISVAGKVAVRMTRDDYEKYDYIIGMDRENIVNILKIAGGNDPKHKVFALLDFTDNPRSILDPWYTGDFDATYDDVILGLTGFLNFVNSKN